MEPLSRSNEGQRIAFVLPDLRVGGAERLTVDLAGEFLERGHGVDLVLLRRQGEFLGQLAPGARVIDLGARRLRHALLPLRRYIRRRRPDAICAAMWPLPVVTIAATLGLGGQTRVIASEHVSLIRQYGASRWQSMLLRTTIRLTYRFAHGIVGVSDGVSAEVARLAGLDRARVATIRNPVKRPPGSGILPENLWGNRKGKRILAVGRLKPQKNFALLIRAFARLAKDDAATLAIVGGGEERAGLEALIRELGLEGRVLLPGQTLTPGDWYAGADLFVLSSDYEGFALVLAEAMHFGLPIVATDCPHGPAEVLEGGRWGRLVPPGDADALAQAMAAALADPPDPARQRSRAAAFSVQRAADAYARLFFGECRQAEREAT